MVYLVNGPKKMLSSIHKTKFKNILHGVKRTIYCYFSGIFLVFSVSVRYFFNFRPLFLMNGFFVELKINAYLHLLPECSVNERSLTELCLSLTLPGPGLKDLSTPTRGPGNESIYPISYTYTTWTLVWNWATLSGPEHGPTGRTGLSTSIWTWTIIYLPNLHWTGQGSTKPTAQPANTRTSWKTNCCTT